MSLAKRHPSKPVSKEQKKMSKRHLKRRAQLKKMKPGKIKDLKEKFTDLAHGAEHLENADKKGMAKKLKKQAKVIKAKIKEAIKGKK